MKLSTEAYELIMRLLHEEHELQSGHEDRQEEVATVMNEVEEIGTY